jgi:hypothetical protein
MVTTILIVLGVLGTVSSVYAEDVRSTRKPLFLSTAELIKSYDASTRSHDASMPPLFRQPGRAAFDVLDSFKDRRVGIMPLFALVPGKEGHDGEAKAPRFALIARAKGRTMVSFTRTGAKNDRDDEVLVQRTVISDLFQTGQSDKFSVAIQEDHTLDGHAMKFVGIGARFMARPDMKVLGWGLRLQMFTSFHPKRGGTAYFAITGSPDERALSAPPALSSAMRAFTPLPPAQDWNR